MFEVIPNLEYSEIKWLAGQVEDGKRQTLVDRICHAAPALAGKTLPSLEKMQEETAAFIHDHTEWVRDIGHKEGFDALLQLVDFNNDDDLRQIFGDISPKNKAYLLREIAHIQKMPNPPSSYKIGFESNEDRRHHEQRVDMMHAIEDLFKVIRHNFSGEEYRPDSPMDRMETMVMQREIDWLKKQPEATQKLTWLLTKIYREADGETIDHQCFGPALAALNAKDLDIWGKRNSFSSLEVLDAAKGLYDVEEIILEAAREANKSAKILGMDTQRAGQLRGKMDPDSGALSIFKNFADQEPMHGGITEIVMGNSHIPAAALDYLAKNPRALEALLKDAGIAKDRKWARG